MTKKNEQIEWKKIAWGSLGLGLGTLGAFTFPALTGGSIIAGTLAVMFMEGKKKDPPPKKIKEVIDNLEVQIKKKNGQILKPKIIHQHEEPYGYFLSISLPSGISDTDLFKIHREFEIATNSEIEMYEEESKVNMKIHNHKMPKIVNTNAIKEIAVASKAIENMKLPLIIGKSRAGWEIIDLILAKHILIAGETGGGKTNLFRLIAFCLMKQLQSNVKLFVIDIKRNLGFLRKYSWFAYENDGVADIFAYLANEMDRRYELLDYFNKDSIEELPPELKSKLPYLVVLIDEYGGISPELASGDEKKRRQQISDLIVDMINRGRGCGLFLILGTQRPDAKIMSNGQIKSQMNVRFAFRTVDADNSRIVIDNPMAAFIPQDIEGRCIFRSRAYIRQCQIMNLPRDKMLKMLPDSDHTKPDIVKDDTSKDGEIDLID